MTLLTQRCTPLEGRPPMTPDEVHQLLEEVQGWRFADAAIERSFAFKNFHETMAFVNALAWICHAEDHHPDLNVSYNRCVVRFNTHSVGGISINDFICAAKANALVTHGC